MLLVTCYLLLSLSPKPHTLNPNVLAQGTECQEDDINPRATGLISIGTDTLVQGTFGNPDKICAIDPKAAFISYKLPSYQDLKSRHFDQSKANKVTFSNTLPAISDQTVYYTAGGLNLLSNPTGSGTAVIFIGGNFDLNAGITYGTVTTGLVFVVKGDVNIATGVNILNAVIIAQGQIFTAGAGCTTSSSSPSVLTVNGSLISLDSAKPIRFCRTSGDTNPAEVINHQSKYVVILKDLFSGTLQKWTEVAGVPFIPVQLPTPTPTPTPTPLPCPTGLTAYWKMDETTGSSISPSFGTATGAATGTTAVTGQDSKINYARNFDGIDDYISFTTGVPTGATGGSISFWVKPTAWPGFMAAAGVAGSDFIMHANTSDAIYGFFNDPVNYQFQTGASGVPTIGAWNHVVMIWGGSGSVLYINGTDRGGNSTGGPGYSGANLLLGHKQDGGTFFNGIIDEVGIWNKALTQAEITQLYAGGAGKSCP